MTKELIILALIIALIYFYYQKKTKFIGKLTQTDQTLMSLLKVNSLEELKTKLGEKNLDEILAENEDYETEVDTLTRTKNSLEADLLAQSNAFQNRLREKDREVKKLQEDLKDLAQVRAKLTSEKQQHKGSLARISKLTERITELEKISHQLDKTQELQQDLSLKEQKIKALETNLFQLAKQKLTNQKQAKFLVEQMEKDWIQKQTQWESQAQTQQEYIKQLLANREKKLQSQSYNLADFKVWLEAGKSELAKARNFQSTSFIALYQSSPEKWTRVCQGLEGNTLRQEIVSEWQAELDAKFTKDKN